MLFFLPVSSTLTVKNSKSTISLVPAWMYYLGSVLYYLSQGNGKDIKYNSFVPCTSSILFKYNFIVLSTFPITYSIKMKVSQVKLQVLLLAYSNRPTMTYLIAWLFVLCTKGIFFKTKTEHRSEKGCRAEVFGFVEEQGQHYLSPCQAKEHW